MKTVMPSWVIHVRVSLIWCQLSQIRHVLLNLQSLDNIHYVSRAIRQLPSQCVKVQLMMLSLRWCSVGKTILMKYLKVMQSMIQVVPICRAYVSDVNSVEQKIHVASYIQIITTCLVCLHETLWELTAQTEYCNLVLPTQTKQYSVVHQSLTGTDEYSTTAILTMMLFGYIFRGGHMAEMLIAESACDKRPHPRLLMRSKCGAANWHPF